MRTKLAARKVSAKILSCLSGFRRAGWRLRALQYVWGLLLLVRFRSQAELARQIAGAGPDGLHHFMHDAPWDDDGVRDAMQEDVARVARRFAGVKLIIDDTPVKREGPRIEGIGIHHGAKGLMKGLCAVTACVLAGSLRLAFAAIGYRREKDCPRGGFRSKVELAVEVLKRARAVGLGPSVTVLVDSWYACRRLLNMIQLYGWRYVAALRENRVVIVGGCKMRVSDLAKARRAYVTVRLSAKRVVRAAKVDACLPGVGPVALFVTGTRKGKKYLVSNDPDLDARAAVLEYDKRFGIETWHRDVKQHLGFGELWTRSWRAVQRHWTLCLVAHNALQMWNASLPHRSRQQTCGGMARALRRAVAIRPLRECLRPLARAA
ncbi:MAG: transposase [Planctomycetota bacterium]|nr:transposase [Planctomycetota bacterium]